jgi:hypothetical protein
MRYNAIRLDDTKKIGALSRPSAFQTACDLSAKGIIFFFQGLLMVGYRASIILRFDPIAGYL